MRILKIDCHNKKCGLTGSNFNDIIDKPLIMGKKDRMKNICAHKVVPYGLIADSESIRKCRCLPNVCNY